MRQATAKNQTDTLTVQLGRRLREGTFILFISLAVYLLISLLSYQGSDPGWSHSGSATGIANLGGKTGAWLADVLFSIFGFVAYSFPMAIVISGYLVYKEPTKEKTHPLVWLVRSVGLFLAMMASCGLTAMHLVQTQVILPMSSGGVLGAAIKSLMVSQLNFLGSTVILLSFTLIGITLFTGLSWLSVMDMTGHYGMKLLNLLKQAIIKGAIKSIEKAKTLKQLDLNFEKFKFKPKMAASGTSIIIQPEQTTTHIEEEEDLPPVMDPISPRAPSMQPKPEIKTGTLLTSTSIKRKKSIKPRDYSSAIQPSLSLLDSEGGNKYAHNRKELEQFSKLVENRLAEFGVSATVVAVHPGPVVTRFEIDLAAGVKVSKITGLAKDLARSLSVISVRVVEVIPGKSYVGIEIPNQHRETVRLKEILVADAYQHAESPLTLALGKDISGKPMVADLSKMPHLLVAGTTGSGKSVGLNAMLLSILYKASPVEVRMILIDPKMLELAVYDDIPHLLTPVVTDMKDAANALRWCVAEMERRYQLMAALGVRNLKGYNQKVEDAIKAKSPILNPLHNPHLEEPPEALEKLPYIVVVVDEFADMMMVVGKKVEELIARIAQKARAAGIHLILATQRPSVDVITGLIKANIPTRIAFQVSSRIDSRTILDQHGAEQLLGHGDMLYLPPGSGLPTRIHGAFVADEEVHNVTKEWRKQGKPDYIDNVVNNSVSIGNHMSEDEYDELYDEAVKIVTESRRASISHVQRRLKIGYNRAARLIEQMENDGVVSAMQSNGSREVIAPPPTKV